MIQEIKKKYPWFLTDMLHSSHDYYLVYWLSEDPLDYRTIFYESYSG